VGHTVLSTAHVVSVNRSNVLTKRRKTGSYTGVIIANRSIVVFQTVHGQTPNTSQFSRTSALTAGFNCNLKLQASEEHCQIDHNIEPPCRTPTDLCSHDHTSLLLDETGTMPVRQTRMQRAHCQNLFCQLPCRSAKFARQLVVGESKLSNCWGATMLAEVSESASRKAVECLGREIIRQPRRLRSNRALGKCWRAQWIGARC
jgi:hypothetical protein